MKQSINYTFWSTCASAARNCTKTVKERKFSPNNNNNNNNNNI